MCMPNIRRTEHTSDNETEHVVTPWCEQEQDTWTTEGKAVVYKSNRGSEVLPEKIILTDKTSIGTRHSNQG